MSRQFPKVNLTGMYKRMFGQENFVCLNFKMQISRENGSNWEREQRSILFIEGDSLMNLMPETNARGKHGNGYFGGSAYKKLICLCSDKTNNARKDIIFMLTLEWTPKKYSMFVSIVFIGDSGSIV